MPQKKNKAKLPTPSHFVGIGASAGGLEAIEAFFKSMPATSGLAFVVVQHLSPDYKSLMVELLSKKTEMPVHRAEDGMEVLADNVYLIPPKKNLTIFHGKLVLNDKATTQGINLPIDIFLRSLAEDQGERTVAIILSGTGSDGARGVRAIKEMGGMVMVQSEDSAKFDGMPKAAIATGVADFVLPPEKMPEQLLAYIAHPYVSGAKQSSDLLLHDADALTRLFAELRDKTRADFTYYKPSTITRRIERRMSVTQISDFEEYVRFLQNTPGEVNLLYRDLLIGVTSFFRDPEPMAELEEKWLPELLLRVRNREIRFWVAGCSTGEEAYTLAIMLKEAMEKAGVSRDVKIFATDIDKEAVLTASAGIYPDSIVGDLPAKMVGKYFYHKDEKLHIARHLREMVVFAQHNLVKDPPFTNIDLISCRNLLIYLQPVLQQKAFEMFNFSLNPDGLLFLGTSESIGEMGDYFATLHAKHKIYRSKGHNHPPHRERHEAPAGERRPAPRTFAFLGRERRSGEGDGGRIVRQFLDLAAGHYLPLAVVTNEQLEILHIVGNSEGLFRLPSGPAEYDITRMVVPELAIPLATGIHKVFRSGEPLTYTNVRLQRHDRQRHLTIRIFPMPETKGQLPLAAVFFEDVERQAGGGEESRQSYNLGEDAQRRIADLEQELQFARENLQATIEELETSNEELQATNEELLASNEELQSTNEELQSTNEELYTVNAEHQNKIIELTELNNDVDNLLTSSRIGTLLLDEDLEIRKFSPEIVNVFHILDKDVGRPITHIAHRLVQVDPLALIKKVQNSNTPLQQEIATDSGRLYLARIMPYAIGPSTYSGVILTFIDITEIRATEQRLASSRQATLDIGQYMPSGLFIYQRNSVGDFLLESCNPQAERLTGVTLAEWGGKSFTELWPQAEEVGLVQRMRRVMESGRPDFLEEFAYRDERLAGTYRLSIFRLPEQRLAITFEDVSEARRLRRDLEDRERQCRDLFETMAQGVVYQDRDGRIVSANPAAQRILGLSLDQMRGISSLDPRWEAIREDGSALPGEEHPAMLSLASGKPVFGFIMGVRAPNLPGRRWILVNACPLFKEGEKKPSQVYTTFEDITDRYDFLARRDGGGQPAVPQP